MRSRKKFIDVYYKKIVLVFTKIELLFLKLSLEKILYLGIDLFLFWFLEVEIFYNVK